MSTATAYDVTPAQFRRSLARQSSAGDARPATVLDDMADGIEAVQQLATLANFGARARAFVFAVATAAHSGGTEFVELYDAELARLQGCSERTVQRQRRDYNNEARALRFHLLEIIDGEVDGIRNKTAPTKYCFHLGGHVERIVTEARRTPGWEGLGRGKQREAIRRAAEAIFDEIPDARRQGRRRKRPRLAEAEIASRLKAAETNIVSASETASKLPEPARARLAEDGSELRERLLRMRAEIDCLLAADLPQAVDAAEVDRGIRQLVRAYNEDEPQTVTPDEVEHPPEVISVWNSIAERLTRPRVQTVEIALVAVDSPPDESGAEEAAERAAIMEFDGGLERQKSEGLASSRDHLLVNSAGRVADAQYLTEEADPSALPHLRAARAISSRQPSGGCLPPDSDKVI